MWYSDITNFFNQIGQFTTDVVSGLLKLIAFIKDCINLLINLVTIFPTRFNTITAVGIGLLSIIIIYKITRKG